MNPAKHFRFLVVSALVLAGASGCGGGGGSGSAAANSAPPPAPATYNLDAFARAHFLNGYTYTMNDLNGIGYRLTVTGAAAVASTWNASPASAVSVSDATLYLLLPFASAAYTDYYVATPFTRLARQYASDTYPYMASVGTTTYTNQVALPTAAVPSQYGNLDSHSTLPTTLGGYADYGTTAWTLSGGTATSANFCLNTTSTQTNVVPNVVWYENDCYQIDTAGNLLGHQIAFLVAPIYNYMNVNFQ